MILIETTEREREERRKKNTPKPLNGQLIRNSTIIDIDIDNRRKKSTHIDK